MLNVGIRAGYNYVNGYYVNAENKNHFKTFHLICSHNFVLDLISLIQLKITHF